jgi:hypothetical protein
MSENEISEMLGSSASSGSSGLAFDTWSRTFWSASSITTSGSNSMLTTETPSAEVLFITFTSRRPASSFSSGMVTRPSMSSGATPT